MAPSEEQKRILAEHLFHAFAYAGDVENEFRAIQALAKAFPGYQVYHEEYALVCLRRGLVEEASNVINTDIADSYGRAVALMKERGYDRPVQLILDGDVLFDTFGELGCRFDLYIKARILGIVPPVRVLCRSFMLGGPGTISNRFLLDCWKTQAKDHIEFIDSPEVWSELRKIHHRCGLQLTTFTLPDGTGTGMLPARNYAYKRWHDEGRAPLLSLPEETKRAGRTWLESLGMPKDAWFVCLHLRDGGYKGDPKGGYNELRNTRPDNYARAIRTIIERGGWVIRIGNRASSALNDFPQLIDYANAADQADWKDIFLLARCRFFLGNNSGPIGVAQVFGTPTIMTDLLPIANSYGTPRDIVIHKLLRHGAEGKYLPIREASAYGIGGEHSPRVYAERGLTVEDNASEDIVDTVTEMLGRLEGTWSPSEEDIRRQQHYAAHYAMAPYGTGANIGAAFLAKHPFLIEE